MISEDIVVESRCPIGDVLIASDSLLVDIEIAERRAYFTGLRRNVGLDNVDIDSSSCKKPQKNDRYMTRLDRPLKLNPIDMFPMP